MLGAQIRFATALEDPGLPRVATSGGGLLRFLQAVRATRHASKVNRLATRVSFAVLGKKIPGPIYTKKPVQKSSVEGGGSLPAVWRARIRLIVSRMGEF
jgi:hypothetical protein